MKEYVVSCNPTNFDIVKHFSNTGDVVWRQTKPCQVGDIVYIYVGRPYSAIKYCCVVIEANINASEINTPFYKQQSVTKRNREKPFMRLRLEQTLNEDGLRLPELIEHGLKTVQCTTMVNAPLKRYLDEKRGKASNGKR